MPFKTIKGLWERIDGRVGLFTGLIVGWFLGLATYGAWLSLKTWVTSSWLWSKIFGHFF